MNTIFEEAADCRISGNFIGVLPDGLSTISASDAEKVGEGDAVEGGGLGGLTGWVPMVMVFLMLWSGTSLVAWPMT